MNMLKETPRIGQQLLDVPMGEMIESMAMSIAKAQMALDTNSIEVAEMMGGLKAVTTPVRKSNGEVEDVITFADSRVFFGKEKISVENAVVTYNTSQDEALKSQVFTPDTSAQGDPSNGINEDIFEETTTGSGIIKLKSGNTLTEVIVPQRLSMLELGFSPTFYQFVDTMIRVSISITFSREGSSSIDIDRNTESKSNSASFSWRKGLKTNKTVTTTQVNANFSQKYSYSAEGSSILQTKLVPIPPPAVLEERIQQQMEISRQEAES